MPTSLPSLFTPLRIREVTLPNRIVVSPMCLYSAVDGFADDYHLLHYGALARGGSGLVIVEATAVEPEGRITHGCTGLWSDDQIAPMRRIANIIRSQGAVPGIQLGHAGRKASSQRPWQGGEAIREDVESERPWRTVAPSALAPNPKRATPDALDADEMDRICRAWGAAARRALTAGFEVIEIHGAHGYLIHTFLSAISNRRDDTYGGSLENRMRYPLEIAAAVRAEWPETLPAFFRVSAIDGIEDGWTMADTRAFAERLAGLGYDVLDCSSGGVDAERSRTVATALDRRPGFQVPFAEEVKQAGIMSTMAVGLIVAPHQADAIVAEGKADLVCLGRELLNNPQWPLHAATELMGDAGYDVWPPQYEWSLRKRSAWIAAHGSGMRLTMR